MGDDGLATGAALFKCVQLCERYPQAFVSIPTPHVYWGPKFFNHEIERELDALGVAYEYHDDIEMRVSQLLAKGRIVSRFAGRMEYGPRVLGNRSILFQPVDTSVNEWLNMRLKRTESMPFTPVTVKACAHQCYSGLECAEFPPKFMTVPMDCSKEMTTMVQPSCISTGPRDRRLWMRWIIPAITKL